MRSEKDYHFKGEIVSFAASDGAMLYAMLCKPKKATKTAIINIHGMSGGFYRGFLPMEIGNELTKRGFVFMSLELRGSYNKFRLNIKKKGKWNQVIAGGDVEVFEECVHDIAGAVKYLRSMGIRRIYLNGYSTGAQKEVYYLIKSNEKSVKGIIMLGPGDDYNLWKSKQFGHWKKKGDFENAVRFAKDKAKKNPFSPMSEKYANIWFGAQKFLSVADLNKVEARILNYDGEMKEFSKIKVPMLAVFGSKDQYVLKPPREYLKILGKRTGSDNFMGGIMPGANHNFRGKEKELAKFVGDWIVAMEKEIE